MDKVKLPVEKASEPYEEARQPKAQEMGDASKSKSKKKTRFAQNELESCSQDSSSTYKDALSQPAPGLSHREHMLWLQKRRNIGLWVQCDDCDKWRYMPHILDRHELPKTWFCKLNPDKKMANCSIPEAPLRIRDEEDLIHNEYSAGSVVWAKMPNWPWWPAMVDDCPDTEQFYWLDGFSDIPTHYNVVFFDAVEVTRAWIAPQQLKPFETNTNLVKRDLKSKKFKHRLEVAMRQANDANNLPPMKRLETYSFIAKYKGSILKPRKISKDTLKKVQREFQKKFHVDFPIESTDDSESDFEDEVPLKTVGRKRKTPMSPVQKITETPKRSNKEITNTENSSKKIAETPKRSYKKVPKLKDLANMDTEESTQVVTTDDNTVKYTDSLIATNTTVEESNTCINKSPVKEPHSMSMQIGSPRLPSNIGTESIPKDVIVPETETFDNETQRVPSPNSDDFEF